MAIQYADLERIMTTRAALPGTLRLKQMGLATDTGEFGIKYPDGATMGWFAPYSTDTALGSSNVLTPTQNAVKTYVDNALAGASTEWTDGGTWIYPTDLATKDVHIGGIIDPVAKLGITDTVEQLRLNYTNLIYTSISTNASGYLTVDSTGNAAVFENVIALVPTAVQMYNLGTYGDVNTEFGSVGMSGSNLFLFSGSTGSGTAGEVQFRAGNSGGADLTLNTTVFTVATDLDITGGLTFDGTGSSITSFTNDLDASATANQLVTADEVKDYVDTATAGDSPWERTTTPDYVVLKNAGDSVGIGISTPERKFHVYSADSTFTSGANTIGLFEGAGSDVDIEIMGGTDQRLKFSDSSTGRGQIRYNHSSDLMAFHVGSAGQAMTILNTGFVGIGITPTDKLHLNGGHFQMSGGSGLAIKMIPDANDEWRILAGNDYDGLALKNQTDAVARLVLLDTGNSGFDTETPSRKLEVHDDSGNAQFRLSYSTSWCEFYQSTGGGLSLIFDGGSGQIDFNDGIINIADNSGTAGSLTLENSAGNAGSFINGDGISYIEGQLGVGNKTPDGFVHLHRASAGAVTASTDADELVIEDTVSSGMSFLCQDGGTNRIYFGDVSDNDIGGIIYNHANNTMSLYTNTANAVIIRDTGNVGINTAVADAKLEIKSASGETVCLDIDRATGTGVELINVQGYGQSEMASIQMADPTATVLGSFVFRTRDSGGVTEKMRIHTNGFIGIGTDSPQDLVHIATTGADTTLRFSRDTAYVKIELPSSNIFTLHNYTTDGDISFETITVKNQSY